MVIWWDLMVIYYNLLGGIYPSEKKYEQISWDYNSQYMEK